MRNNQQLVAWSSLNDQLSSFFTSPILHLLSVYILSPSYTTFVVRLVYMKIDLY